MRTTEHPRGGMGGHYVTATSWLKPGGHARDARTFMVAYVLFKTPYRRHERGPSAGGRFSGGSRVVIRRADAAAESRVRGKARSESDNDGSLCLHQAEGGATAVRCEISVAMMEGRGGDGRFEGAVVVLRVGVGSRGWDDVCTLRESGSGFGVGGRRGLTRARWLAPDAGDRQGCWERAVSRNVRLPAITRNHSIRRDTRAGWTKVVEARR